MHLSSKDVLLLFLGIVGSATFAYMANNRVDTQGKGQPRYEGQAGGSLIIDHLDTGDHYFHPNMCYPGQDQIFTPHRYPKVSGGNITTLIHQGFDAMRRQAPQDADWIEQPPADVMW